MPDTHTHTHVCVLRCRRPAGCRAEGLREKDAVLSAMRGELQALREAAARMVELEAELAASSQQLAAMDAEEAAAAQGATTTQCVFRLAACWTCTHASV